jgi:NAD+ synthase (glutamine-hydrolysing)
MKLIKVAAGVLNQTPLDWEKNLQNILNCIQKAKQEGASILCLPELCITGYGCEDAFYAPFVQETALEVLTKIAPQTQDLIVSVGLPLVVHNKLFNTACILAHGKILGFVAKRFLAGDGIHYEPRWFMPWKPGQKSLVEINGERYPVGDYYFEIGGIKLGFEICEDAWVANRPGRDLYQKGIDLILNPSASHFAFGKINIRKRFVLEGSRAFGVGYIYANLLGNEAGRAIYDGGALIASGGELLAAGERLTFEDYQITTAVIDVNINRMAQIQNRAPVDLISEDDNCISADFQFPEISFQKPTPKLISWENSASIKEEEFTRALALGLYDYMRKSRSNGFVVSLSGGADSAAVACLVRLMIEIGIESVGLESFLAKLSHISALKSLNTIDDISKAILICAYQASKNSGNVTLNAATEVAKALNSTFYVLDISALVDGYQNLISQSIQRELSWQKDDITLQNIQARVRAPSIWMYANINNALLLSTSNRSEAAVGYATMDGDTAGGLSPIAGIDKAFLRQWLRWLEKIGLNDKIKISALKFINEQQPTAELRPAENKQTDEDDLMPYDVLDEIEEYAIRDKKSPIECYKLLQAKYSQYSKEQLKAWTTKFFKLWCRNQWKRERYAPSFHLDDKNLDPKTWCRFPILSGGFDKELRDLNAIE